jgi:gamma-glutamyltranspeptidase/glutathione hydrolase
MDAAVAANLALGVVAPYFCGPGGDLFAIVWDGRLHGYLGAGRAPAGETAAAVARRHDGRMPFFGGDVVTVPGAVAGWFTLLERWGTRTFGDLAAGARALASEGFTVGAHGAREFAAARDWYRSMAPWQAQYGAVGAGTRFRQPATARLLDRHAADGPDAFYRGPVAEAVAEAVADAGGGLTPTTSPPTRASGRTRSCARTAGSRSRSCRRRPRGSACSRPWPSSTDSRSRPTRWRASTCSWRW